MPNLLLSNDTHDIAVTSSRSWCNLVASGNLEQLILLSAHILFISAHIYYPYKSYNRFDRLLSLLTVCNVTIMLFAVVNQFSVTPISCFWTCQSPSQSLQLLFSNQKFWIILNMFFFMFGIIVISLRRIEKPAVLLKNDDIRYSLQDSLHQDRQIPWRLWLGPDNLPQSERTNLGAKGDKIPPQPPERPPRILWYPNCHTKKNKLTEMAEKTGNSIFLFCWGRLCNVVFHACLNSLNSLNSLNMSEWWLVVHHLKGSKLLCSDHWQPEDSSPRPTSSSQPPDLGSRETFSAVQKPGPFAIAKRHTKHLQLGKLCQFWIVLVREEKAHSSERAKKGII